ncbi:UDP-glucose 6-dehydrogenase, partial [Agrobacterium tumefaciens]|nr:UDP-glucose 6-dehydrogenase [Agrobacterium tumefaciens]
HVIEDIDYASGPYEAAEGADALVIVTEWNQFRALDLPRLKAIMKNPVLVDLRNIYRTDEIEEHGFLYRSVGRPS